MDMALPELTHAIARNLNSAKKFLLSTAGMAALALPVANRDSDCATEPIAIAGAAHRIRSGVDQTPRRQRKFWRDARVSRDDEAGQPTTVAGI
jgi:hypothetical protein